MLRDTGYEYFDGSTELATLDSVGELQLDLHWQLASLHAMATWAPASQQASWRLHVIQPAEGPTFTFLQVSPGPRTWCLCLCLVHLRMVPHLTSQDQLQAQSGMGRERCQAALPADQPALATHQPSC